MGEPTAAYEVYAALALCSDTQPTVAGESNSPTEEEARELVRMRRLCADVSPAQVQERMQFLAAAARQGVREALIAFYAEGPYGRDVDPDLLLHDAVAREWRAAALRYLQQAAAQCEPRAYRLLATQYETGELAPANARLALVYSAAEAQALGRPTNMDHLRRRYGGRLKAEDIQAAQREGQGIAIGDCHL